MKIVVLEQLAMMERQRKELEALGTVEWHEKSSPSEASARVAGADVVVVDWVDPNPFLLQMKRPSLVALMSTGFDWITNISVANKNGILVANIPDYATEAVAEHIFALTFGVARQLVLADQTVRAGNPGRGMIQGLELFKKEMGIIGPGRIGRRVATLAQALSMEVVVARQRPIADSTFKTVDLEVLLRTSDVVAITCSLNDSTRNLLNRQRLSLLKAGAILVSTTWGVVDIDALAEVIERGAIRGAGIDVAVEGGEINLSAHLLSLPGLLYTPHIGFNTQEARVRQVDTLIANIRAFIAAKPTNIVSL